MYCSNCGKELPENAIRCCFCDYNICSQEIFNKSTKQWLITLLLCIFVGEFGIHRFYTGYIGIGIIQLLTLGGFGFWWLIDLICIAIGKYKTKSGQRLNIEI